MSTTRISPALRTTASAAFVLTLIGLSSCSGNPSSAPDDASVTDFCAAYNALISDVFAPVDDSVPADEQADRTREALQGWAEGMVEVGTPSTMPADARAGYERQLDTIRDLNEDTDLTDLSNLEQGYSDDERADAQSLSEFVTTECSFGLGEL